MWAPPAGVGPTRLSRRSRIAGSDGVDNSRDCAVEPLFAGGIVGAAERRDSKNAAALISPLDRSRK